MNTLNIVCFITGLLERVALRLAPRTVFAERLFWLREDVRVLRRVMRRVQHARRYQAFSYRPGTTALAECQLHRAARILGEWLYYQPMNHRFVSVGMCDVNATALSLAPVAWLDGLKAGYEEAVSMNADEDYDGYVEAQAWLASQYRDVDEMVAECP